MLPHGAPKLEEILIQSEAMPWREKSLKGVHEKMLWRDQAPGASIALIRFDKGVFSNVPSAVGAGRESSVATANRVYTSGRAAASH